MAECIDIQAELSAYLDGELTAQERSTLDAHLSTCPECRAMLEELRGVTSMMSDLPRVSAPASLMTKVRRDIANEPTLREQTKTAVAFSTIDRGNARPRVHWAPFAFGMAALVLLCLLAFLILPAISHDKVALETPPARSAAAPVAQDEAPAEKEAALRKMDEISPADAKKNDDAIGAALEQKELKKAVAPDAEYRRSADKAGTPAAKNDAILKDRAAETSDARAKDMQPQRKRVEALENAAPVPPAVQAPAPGAVAPPAPVAPNAEPAAPPAPTANRGAPGNESVRRQAQPRDPEARALRAEAMDKQKSAAPEKKSAAAFGNGRDADRNLANVEEKAEKSAGTAAPKPDAKPFAEEDGKRANLSPQKPAEFKGANKPMDAAKLAEAGQQGGQKAGEGLARERQLEQAKSQTALVGAPRDGAATGGLAGKGEAKDSKADANALNRVEQNGQPAQSLAGGGGRGAGIAGKAEAEALKAPGEGAPAPKTPVAATKALVLQQNQAAAETKVVRVHAKDLQRAIGDLKKIVEASGGRWEDVALEAEGKAKEAGGKPSANARREAANTQPSSYVAVTSADKSEALLAQLNAYDKSHRQFDAGDAKPFGADEARKDAANDKDLADKPVAKKAAKRELAEEDRSVARQEPVKTAPSAPAAAAATPAPVNAGEARIQIRIEIIAE